jgi:hypothetical protein
MRFDTQSIVNGLGWLIIGLCIGLGGFIVWTYLFGGWV